jgi:hypothetical protein
VTGAPAPGAPRTPRLLELADLPWIFGLMAVGLALRVRWFSGYGLGDDILFRHGISHLLTNHILSPDNQAYRFTWWLPTAVSCRLFGLGEVPLILPITTVATLGIGLVYLFGKQLWGRAAGVIAALLLIVHPLDFAWSTMIASDILVSFVSALAILFVLRALTEDDPARKRRRWIGAGVSLWLAYHGKVSAVLLFPAVAVICWMNRRRLDRTVLYLLGTVALFFGASVIVSYAFSGDPIAPYHAELYFQGLTGPQAAEHPMSAAVFWAYVSWLFERNPLGNFFFSLYPHLVVLFALTTWWWGIRTSAAVFWWLAFFFLGMQLNIQRINGVWISGFRNVRHGHVFVYPIILLLTGYLVGLRARFPRVTHVLLALLLAFSLWQSVSMASKTRDAFADRRQACQLLATLPPKALYSDFQIPTWCAIVGVQEPEWKFPPLHSFDGAQRKQEIAAITSGYLVTGGGREPYYGCWDCIPQAAEVTPGKWRLLAEFAGPTHPEPWRLEPTRVWERIEGDGGGG